ncbi:MAG: excinuclease ABC subunit UvrC [bacterium]
MDHENKNPPLGPEGKGEEQENGSAPDKQDHTDWEEKARELPAAPGAYIFRDSEGRVIYVGKAKNLRARVRAYTRENADNRYHVRFLQSRIRQLDYIITDTDAEAVILENNLIKKHKPRYNIRLRDDKTYFHLRLTTNEDFPRLMLTRRPKKGGDDILLGPFSSSAAVKETLRTVREIFPLRRCKSAALKKRERPCLNYQIGKCTGPCAGMISKDEYGKIVGQVVEFLKGDRANLVKNLREQMQKAARAEDFERAALLRDRIDAIEKTLERQKVDSVRPRDRDVIGVFREGDRLVIHRLGFRAGVLLSSRSHNFVRVNIPDEEALSSFLSQLYPEKGNPPPELLVSVMPEDADLLRQTFSKETGRKCTIRVPQRGEDRKLVDMAIKNAAETLKQEAEKGEDRRRAVVELQARLRLSREPRWIECVDISLTGGRNAVGSMVKFKDGEPDKSGYRRYRIKTVEGTDDYGMMREVLTRRFKRALDEGQGLPDLLVVDGGKGQLNVARAVLDELGIKNMDAAGLAKDRETPAEKDDQKRKTEKVYIPGVKDPVYIKPGTAALFLLQQVRDEAHRFAVSYHKKIRGEKVRRSSLEDISGIGRKKAAALIKHLGGVAAVKKASLEEIAAVPNISASDAQRIKNELGAESSPSYDSNPKN